MRLVVLAVRGAARTTIEIDSLCVHSMYMRAKRIAARSRSETYTPRLQHRAADNDSVADVDDVRFTACVCVHAVELNIAALVMLHSTDSFVDISALRVATSMYHIMPHHTHTRTRDVLSISISDLTTANRSDTQHSARTQSLVQTSRSSG